MPRQPKPYYRKVQKRWACSIDGQRVTLGEDREAAFRRFHELVLDRENLASQIQTAYGLSHVYLDWCKKHRTKGTYENHKRYLKSFISFIRKSIKVGALKNHHLTKWIDELDMDFNGVVD